MTEETQNPNLVNVQQGSKKFSRLGLAFSFAYAFLALFTLCVGYYYSETEELIGLGIFMLGFFMSLPWSYLGSIFNNIDFLEFGFTLVGPFINAGIIYLVIWKVQTFITAKKYAKTVQD